MPAAAASLREQVPLLPSRTLREAVAKGFEVCSSAGLSGTLLRDRPYTWVRGRGIDTPLGHVPAALLQLLEPRQVERTPQPTVRPATPGHPYGQQALAEEAAAVAAAPKGTRNQQLWRSAHSLYQLVAGGVLDEAEVELARRVAADQCGLSRDEPRATERTLESAREVGMSQPRGIPAPQGHRPLPSGSAIGPLAPDEAPLEPE